MTKAGMGSSPPIINIKPAPTDSKRQGEFWVNDIRSTIGQLNGQIAKASSVGIKVVVALDGDGVRLVSAERK